VIPDRANVTPARAPDILICSALDPSGGAGFIADVRVVGQLGGRPLGVVTALTVQDTRGMRSCHDLDAEVVGVQLNAILSDIEVAAVKLGILGSPAVIRELGANLELTGAPVVWDPVSAPTHGEVSFRELFAGAVQHLGKHLSLITPNARELAEITKAPIEDLAQAVAAAEAFARSAQVAVLLKGGHLGTEESVDVLCHASGVEYLRGRRLAQEDVHGTGCALSSAIATHLGSGMPLVEACRAAKQFVAERIANPVRPGRGAAAVM
jgi:hydroxymethylpyrimidine kinase/phosphomethylpyrimidine kinase